MTDAWQKVEQSKAARILTEVNPLVDPVPFLPESTAVRAQKLSFYPGCELVELTDLSAVPPARKFALYRPGDPVVIDWTNRCIYEANARAELRLDARTVIDYVKFFFAHVRGRHGRFLVTETVDDVRWQSDPPLQGRKMLQDMLKPVEVIGQGEDGTFSLRAHMIFKDSLFETAVHVRPDGSVTMSDEALKVESMPVQQDVLP